jgi:phage FluMu protein Com
MKNSFCPAPVEAQEYRCCCGNLLARLCAEGVELKCRRCKRVVLIPWSTPAAWRETTVQWRDQAKPGLD